MEAPIPPLAALDAAERAGPDTVPLPETREAPTGPRSRRRPRGLRPRDAARNGCSAATPSSRPASRILFVGLAFLAKYAAEHTEVPVELAAGAASARAALVLLAFGWRLRLRRPGYAQVLQGGAVAVLYLTLFAAFRYYGVIAAGAGLRRDGRGRRCSPPRSRCCRTRALSP